MRGAAGPLLIALLAGCGNPDGVAGPDPDAGFGPGDAGGPFARTDTELSTGWVFFKGAVDAGAAAPGFDASSWESVSVPHTWNAIDGQTHDDYYRGPGWYRLWFEVGAALAGARVFLRFEAANIDTQVYVNGRLAGSHRGGFGAFAFDVTDLVTPGESNLLAVRVDNAYDSSVPPLSADFTFFGGIYRPVHLLTTDPLHVNLLDFGAPGVTAVPSSVSATSAELTVTTELRNDGQLTATPTVQATVLDADGGVVTTLTETNPVAPGSVVDFVQQTSIASPHLWNGRADPYLYRVQVDVTDSAGLHDSVTQPLGFRFFAVDPDQGFSLNGHPLDLHGAARHQDRLDHGWAIPETDHDQDFGFFMEIGATAVRLAHYEHAQRFYDLADQNGLVVWAEVPMVDSITLGQSFAGDAQSQLLELIRQTRNHPSVVFYSLSNELGAPPDFLPLLYSQAALARSEAPERLTTLASTNAMPACEDDFLVPDVAGFNQYWGWYYGTTADFGPWADGVHESYPSRAFAMSEYGAGASIHFHTDFPDAGDHTEEYQADFHEQTYAQMLARPYFWGTFVWNMFDFASAGRDEGDTPGRNDKGLVTYDRQTRKDAFYFYKANWTPAPFVYLTSRRFNPRPDAVIDVKAYAVADSVDLVVNGASLGSRTSKAHVYVWPGVRLQSGDNLVQAVATFDGGVALDEVTWTH